SSGTQIPAGTVLGKWEFNNICTRIKRTGYWPFYDYACTASEPVKTVIIFKSGGVKFTASTCEVAANNKNITVPLPQIGTNGLGSIGATAATTPFSIHLTNCHASLNVAVTLHTNNPYQDATGVIAPTAGPGYASGVGVRILKSNGTTPVDFDTAFSTGTTSGNDYLINFYAQYYQTG